ncbi:uncharacterized protein EV422DRAFT_540394 [Fimicolochytrium jonesii]|uniref:uncharacterized protein n=1 Tax=Fimicolochytrium jonesii TaxID=1396493 RepID=UPI0022FF0DC0|nr:uncharacterized protein EV422DRAFT_540394 [Fimicolochytrium jonesii]KAI8817641.1 hypothetical protein EV422DRAFT_540394 [Fimicolochytrium jonesii]
MTYQYTEAQSAASEAAAAAATAPAFPTKTVQTTVNVTVPAGKPSNLLSIPTTIIHTQFANRIMITISQVGTIGCLLEATRDTTTAATATTNLSASTSTQASFVGPTYTETASTQPLPPPPLVGVSVRPLLGTARTSGEGLLHQVYASHILQRMCAARPGEKRGLVLGIALEKLPAAAAEDGDDLADGEEFDDEEGGIGAAERAMFEQIMTACAGIGVW